MSAVSPEKHTALLWVDANQKRLSDFHLEIWRYAETAFREGGIEPYSQGPCR